MNKLLAAFLAVVGGLAGTETGAKTLYVTPAGNDSVSYANNSAATPWATISRALRGNPDTLGPTDASAAAQAGDLVLVAAGTYVQAARNSNQVPALNPVNSGTSGNPITIRAQGIVVLQTNASRGPVAGGHNVSFIVWDAEVGGKWYIDEANAPVASDTGPVVAWRSNDCVISGFEIRGRFHDHPGTGGDNHNGIRLEGANRTVVRNNLIHGIGARQNRGNGIETDGFGDNDAGITLYSSNDCLIEHNEIHTTGTGIYVKDISAGVGGTQARNIIRNNFIHDLKTTSTAGVISQGGHGIRVNKSTDGRMYQNVFRGMESALVLIASTAVTTRHPVNDIFAHNTVHDTASLVSYGSGIDNWENVRIWNNIGQVTAMVVGSPDPDIAGPKDSDFQHNVYFGFPAATFAQFHPGFARTNHTFTAWKNLFGKDAAHPTSVNADPQFVASGNNDFRLRPGSPALNLGVDLLDLNANGSTTDLVNAGAFVSGSETIGVVSDRQAPSSVPTAPTAPAR